MAELKTRILLRSDIASNWSSVNPKLLKGEVGICYDPTVSGEGRKIKFKIGDGVKNWNDLNFIADYDAVIAALGGRVDVLEAGIAAVYTKTQVDSLLAGKVDKVEGSRLMTGEEGTKLEGIEEGAQVNRLEEVKLSGNFLEIKHDVEGHGPYVDLGNIATSGAIEAEVTRATAAEAALGERIDGVEGDVEALEDRVEDIEGKEAGWDAKADKTYVDTELAKKANASDVYTKTEVDGKLADKADASDLETLEGKVEVIEGDYLKSSDKEELEGEIELKANSADVYTKSEVYTKTETETKIADAIAGIKHWSYKVVDVLPTPSKDCEHIIYLVPKGSGKSGYKEYVCINEGTEEVPVWKFEEIGDTDIDLSEYRKSAAQDVIDTEIKGLISDEETRAKAAEQANATAIGDEASARESADNSLQLGIDNLNIDLSDEVTRAKGKEAELNTAIGNEVTRATTAEEALDTKIDGVAEDLSSEVSRAEGVESVLAADIDDLKLDSHTHDNKDELDLVESGDVAKWNAKQDAISVGDNLKFENNKVELDFTVIDCGNASDWGE